MKNTIPGEKPTISTEELSFLNQLDIEIADVQGQYNAYVGGVTITPEPSTDDFLEYKPQ